MNRTSPLFLAIVSLGLVLPGHASSAAARTEAILSPRDASFMETLAAHEVRRYTYLRTGKLLPILPTQDAAPQAGRVIIVARKDRPLVQTLASQFQQERVLDTLAAQAYWLKTLSAEGRQVLLVTGGDDTGTLYGAYRFAEHLGVRFYLDGDVVPDERIALRLPMLDERRAPLFALRGIQPFHDFPEGPDWWNRDDYLAIVSQLPKLRMNFLGLHTYPEGGPNAEPTVWIGQPSDLGTSGRVKFSYPSSYQNTRRGNWGYAAKPTSDFSFGAAALFERDDFGAEVMRGQMPQPATPEGCNDVFNRTGAMLRDAFTHAHEVGVKTCVGTETPLTLPKVVAERLQQQGKNPGDPAEKQALYEGMFRRILQTYPLDYYWFWTPEGWTWEGTKPEQIAATTNDLFAAIAAHAQVHPPFALATCGWVLGPVQDRALFDKILPKDIAVSCINREVGRTPVDRGFAEVSGRGKWAIPWMEDDPGLTSPQLWAGRMRRDAADALRYGCDGLMGIHWRTRVLGPAVSALAQAAWEQGAWSRSPVEQPAPVRAAGPVGGAVADFPNNPIAGTDEPRVYQSVRYNLSAYHLRVPNGACAVTLKFCEPHYAEAGKRVFSVKLQGEPVIANLDIFAKAGQNRALDYTFDHVAVTNGWLDVEFVPVVEFPSIAAIVVRGPGFTQKINCGGEAWGDYTADLSVGAERQETFPPTDDFYRDWARHQLGREVGESAARIFSRIDSHLPRPSDWIDGPGGIRPDKRPWQEVRKEYAFVDEFEELAPKVRGVGNRDRFCYWLNTFRYMRAMAELNCAWGRYNDAVAKIKSETDPTKQKKLARQTALPLRREMVHLTGEVYRHLLALVSNPGEFGTVANWEQHLLPGLLTKPGEDLAQLLGEDLPADAQPAKRYHGPTRVIVPTVRTSLGAGEELNLKVIVLSEQPARAVSVCWRPLGRGKFTRLPLPHVARGVYSGSLPAGASTGDFEYFVEAVPAQGARIRFPVTAPDANQTVVVCNAP